MPFLPIKTGTGESSVYYTISTPTETNAKSIDNELPTLFFMHSLYTGQEIFQLQFGDPRVRRFNCVAVDLREHGLTTGDRMPKGYGAKESAEEMAFLIDALKLSPVHIVSQSMGTLTSLALAVYYPKLVASLFLVSPLGIEEPLEIIEGREEIAQCWHIGITAVPFDEVALQDSIYGALQLGYCNNVTSLINALAALGFPRVFKNWGPNNFDEYYNATVGFFTSTHFEEGEFSAIACPVKLIHCGNDVAYSEEYAQNVKNALQNAGVSVTLDTVPGAPHFGCTTHPNAINPLIHDFVMENTKSSVPQPLNSVVSPWEASLRAAGWKNNDSDSDEDDD